MLAQPLLLHELLKNQINYRVSSVICSRSVYCMSVDWWCVTSFVQHEIMSHQGSQVHDPSTFRGIQKCIWQPFSTEFSCLASMDNFQVVTLFCHNVVRHGYNEERKESIYIKYPIWSLWFLHEALEKKLFMKRRHDWCRFSSWTVSIVHGLINVKLQLCEWNKDSYMTTTNTAVYDRT
jgi:hypothetical protein